MKFSSFTILVFAGLLALVAGWSKEGRTNSFQNTEAAGLTFNLH
jgi:hypothetical protein